MRCPRHSPAEAFRDLGYGRKGARDVSTAALALPVDAAAARGPRVAVLWAVALLGFAAAGLALALALTSDHLGNAGVRVALLIWVLLSYVLAGLVAWARHPGSRLGDDGFLRSCPQVRSD